MTLRAMVELVRAPAALTVPGDVVVGAVAAGRPLRADVAGLGAASVCLYWSGMALNDYADRDVDRVERPHRPVPSGRVSARAACGVAVGLTVAGLGLTVAAGGRRALIPAVPLVASIWAYDLGLKNTALGPAAMASARSLDVLTGAGPDGWRRATPQALMVGLHTLLLMALSRYEVSGATPALPAATLAATVGLAAKTAADGRGGRSRVVTAGLALAYAAAFGRSQAKAVHDPRPRQIQQAVGSGISALVPLQAALTSASGAPGAGMVLAGAFPLTRLLARKVSAT